MANSYLETMHKQVKEEGDTHRAISLLADMILDSNKEIVKDLGKLSGRLDKTIKGIIGAGIFIGSPVFYFLLNEMLERLIK